LHGSFLTITLAAQGPPPAPSFHTEANYVRVDVYPTRDGESVTDLTQQDFEVLENGTPQKIEQFEHIMVRTLGPQDTRREPATPEESRQATADPRARVFVLFLDIDHVEGAAARQIQQPLINGLNRLIGPDDLVAVMTPNMSARDLSFSHRTTTLEGLLAKWWGGRDRDFKDPTEEQYAACYPGIPNPVKAKASDEGIAQEMILRRREQRTLDALLDTVRVLREVREERKAVLVISDGWRLFRPSNALLRPLDDLPPTSPQITIDRRTGRPTTGDMRSPTGINRSICERDRLALAMVDDQQAIRQIQEEANRANASFYPIDPRGLVVFDEQIVPAAGVGVGHNANPTVSPAEDQTRLTTRHTSLRTLADATDGLAVLETNNIAAGFRRIADDLHAYYLIGYYSTGKLDGKFHSIHVRVKRPGVMIRARRGYLAATGAPITANAVPPTVASKDARALQAALGALDIFNTEQPLRVHVAATWTPANVVRMWVVAEPGGVAGAGAESNDWLGGGEADALLLDSSGMVVAATHLHIEPGARSARLNIASVAPLTPGDYRVTIRTKAVGAGAVTAQLLDRRGAALAVPVVAGIRTDADGAGWQTAELALAPLAPGDYIIEMLSNRYQTLAAFRVVP
jgi:VWFA-related protein